MNAARKSNHSKSCLHSSMIQHGMFVREERTLENGSERTELVYKVVSDDDYVNRRPLPTTKEYNLENMLRNGDMPQFVSPNGMLDDTDPTSEQFTNSRDALISQLGKIERSMKKDESQSTIDNPAPVTTEVVKTEE